jgi:hypothetical protein
MEQGRLLSLPHSGVHTICFVWIDWVKNMSAKDNPGPKTSLAVSSTKFCSLLFDERDIEQLLGSKCDDTSM